jgi:demethylmenaquinone methyltransferase/2-methoxy-6-polyprenyl-1,4-benzoquinol methylase
MRPRAKALEELWRVLAPGGRAHILEFGSASGLVWGGAYNLYLERILPFFGGLATGRMEAYRYLARSIREFPPAGRVVAELEEAGFWRVSARRLWGGLVCLYGGSRPHKEGERA